MICLRCGYCCFMYDVVIVSDPNKTPNEHNIEFKRNNQRCKHLVGNKTGEFFCAIHNKEWYDTTPCFQHTQFERKNSNCRIGQNILQNQDTPVAKFINEFRT